MKKYLPCIAGGILGALFLMASVMFFLGLGPPSQNFPKARPSHISWRHSDRRAT